MRTLPLSALKGGSKSDFFVFTALAYARAVLGVVIVSVFHPSVRLSHAWIVTKLNDALQIF